MSSAQNLDHNCGFVVFVSMVSHLFLV